jgi:hypothetical protein
MTLDDHIHTNKKGRRKARGDGGKQEGGRRKTRRGRRRTRRDGEKTNTQRLPPYRCTRLYLPRCATDVFVKRFVKTLLPTKLSTSASESEETSHQRPRNDAIAPEAKDEIRNKTI